MNLDTFLSLPTPEITCLVRDAGPIVCAFPINGTRRWFMLEYEPQSGDDPKSAYLYTMSETHVALYRMLFAHGIDTLLAPVFGPDLMERGDEYTEMAVEGLARLGNHPIFLNFYKEYGVRVSFYGDYRKAFANTPYAYVCKLFDDITAHTRDNDRHHLLFGVCANDAVEAIAELTIQHYVEHGRAPDKQTLIQRYYGVEVPPLNFFIGFDKFCVFDTPLLTTGNEDLYFTVSPSLYLTERQFREMLFDHLYARRMEETDYSDLTPDDIEAMRDFYRANQGKTLGVGAIQLRGGYWYPLPQVELPTPVFEAAT